MPTRHSLFVIRFFSFLFYAKLFIILIFNLWWMFVFSIHALGTHCFHELNGSVSVYCSLFICSFNTSLTAFCFKSLAYVGHTRASDEYVKAIDSPWWKKPGALFDIFLFTKIRKTVRVPSFVLIVGFHIYNWIDG